MVLIKSGHRLVTSDTAWGAGGGGRGRAWLGVRDVWQFTAGSYCEALRGVRNGRGLRDAEGRDGRRDTIANEGGAFIEELWLTSLRCTAACSTAACTAHGAAFSTGGSHWGIRRN